MRKTKNKKPPYGAVVYNDKEIVSLIAFRDLDSLIGFTVAVSTGQKKLKKGHSWTAFEMKKHKELGLPAPTKII